MAEEDIVQKIRIEVDGTDEAEASVKKVGEAIDEIAKSEGGTIKIEAEGADEAVDEIEKIGESLDDVQDKNATIEIKSEGVDDVKGDIEEVKGALEEVTDKGTKIELGLEGADDTKDKIKEVGDVISEVKDKGEDVKVKVEAEGADDAKQALEDVKTEAEKLKDTEATVKVKADGVDETKDKVNELGEAVRAAATVFDVITSAVQGFAEAFVAEIDKAKQSTEQLGDALKGLEGAGAGLKELGASGEQAADGADKASGAMDQLNTAATVLSGGVDLLNAKNILAQQTLVDAQLAATRMASGLGQAATAATQAGTAVAQVATAGAQAAAGVAQIGTAGITAAAGIAQVGTAATATTGVLGALAAAVAAIRAAFSGVLSSITTFLSQLEITRNSVRTLSSTFRLLQIPTGPFTSFISVLARVGNLLGRGGVIAVGLAAIGAALVKLGTDALAAQKNIDKMAEGMGTSFSKMSASQEVFAKLGVSAKQFGDVYEKVIERVVSKSAELSEKLASSSDKAAAAIDKVAEARMKLAEAEARVSGGEEAEKAVRKANEQERAVLAANEAYRQLGAAVREAAAAAANDLGRVVEKVEQMKAGLQGVNFDRGTDIATVLNAVDVALGKVAASGGNVYEALAQIIANAPKLQAIEIGKAFDIPEIPLFERCSS